MSNPATYLFVYGTLRRTCSTGAHKTYLNHATFIGNAKIQAKLFKVSYYPAIELSNEDVWVIGEVYQLTDSRQLTALDQYEECTWPSEPHHEYRRELTPVKMDSGELITAWTYIYNRTTANYLQIESGDFLLEN